MKIVEDSPPILTALDRPNSYIGRSVPRPNLARLREAFAAEHALQCGFCTPGMLMTATDLLKKYPLATDEQIREGLSGNLCRCTGYENIVAAVRAARDAR